MVTIEECIGMSGMSEDELDVVARHEHVPVMVALELASGLLRSRRGIYRLHTMFRDTIAEAADCADRERERWATQIYQGFCMRHPTPRQL